LDVPLAFQVVQFELTRLFGPTAVITMVNGVQPTPQATLIPTGVRVKVPDLITVKVVMLAVLITPLAGITAAPELAMVICKGSPQVVGLIIEFTQSASMAGKATVKVDPIVPVNDSIGLETVESQVVKLVLLKSPAVGTAEALGAVTSPPMTSPDRSNAALKPARSLVTRMGQRLQ